MNTALTRRYDALLLQERDRLLAALHRIEEEESEPQAVSAGDTVRAHKSLADTASDTQEQEMDFLIATRLSERLARVDEALARLQGTEAGFGVCTECGRPIEVRRLEEVPWSSLCAPCAIEAERPED